MLRAERMISLLSYRVLKSGGSGIDIQPYEFDADFGEKPPQEEPQEVIQAEEEDPEAVRRAEEEAQRRRAIQEEYEKARREAQEILDKARDEAAEIIRKAGEDGYRKGYDDGHTKGYDDGYQSAHREMTEKMESEIDSYTSQMRQVIDSVTEEKEKVLEQYLDDLKKICLAVSEKIIQVSLRSSGEVIKRMIVSATDKIKKTQWAKIYISRQDSEMIVKGDTQLLHEMARLTDNLKVVVMEKESPGTCIIELPDEIVDASVSTQLENIRDILNNARL